METLSTGTFTEYERSAAALALMPDTVARLLVKHARDSVGRRQGCTKPGTGYPVASHPFALHQLAVMALAARERTANP